VYCWQLSLSSMLVVNYYFIVNEKYVHFVTACHVHVNI